MLDIEKVTDLYLHQGLSCLQIAKMTGYSSSGILKFLVRSGIPVRGKNGKKKVQNCIVSDFFQRWSPDMAWLLGYTLADGCVRPDRYELSYKSIDYVMLDKVKGLLQSNSEIRDSGKIYSLSIYSSQIVQDLQLLGITARKSLTVQMPPVPTEYFWDFLRGVIDGDGSIRSPSNSIGFTVTGSLSLITTIREELMQRTGCPLYQLQSAGRAYTLAVYGGFAAVALRAMYGAPLGYALPRKRAAARHAIAAYHLNGRCVTCGSVISDEDLTIHHRRRRRFCTVCIIKRRRDANKRSYHKRKYRVL